MAKIYKVYVCHSWDNLNDLLQLRNLLNNRGYFNIEFKEHSPENSINSLQAGYIKQRLKNTILNSDIVIGLAGIYSSHSEWVEWELQTAFDNNIPIIGIAPHGQIRLSTIVDKRAKTVIRWNTESIVAAIRQFSK